MDSNQIKIRALEPGDLAVLHTFVDEHFGGEPIVTRTMSISSHNYPA